jgi:ubiquitin-like protein Pup
MRITTDFKRHACDTGDADRDLLPIYGAAAEGGQKQVPKKGGDDSGSEEGAGGPQKLAKKGEKLKDEMDALVDEIDEVLEENAEEFVKNYVQRGGE